MGQKRTKYIYGAFIHDKQSVWDPIPHVHVSIFSMKLMLTNVASNSFFF